ncbi:unnamed protein product, partial [Rotaria sordida]
KHVIFGHVVSGQAVVDTIESLPVDPNTNRPLKDALISHCGQLEIVTKSNKSKKRKISTGDGSENENVEENNNNNDDDESSSTSGNDEKKKKSKHNKKKKHRRKKETKRLATKIGENKNDIDNNINEISKRSNIDSGDISEQKLSTRSSLNDKEKSNNDETINNERTSR